MEHLYINKQLYCECQLISLLNIYLKLYGKAYCKQNSKTYEKLVDITGSRYGGAICTQKLFKRLKITPVFSRGYREINSRVLPLEACIKHKKYGFHSIAIVDYCKKSKAVRVPNFDHETSNDGWIFIEDLNHFIVTNFSREFGIVRVHPEEEDEEGYRYIRFRKIK